MGSSRDVAIMADEKIPAMDISSNPGEVENGTVTDHPTIKRDLQRRHINMIAIAGMIGTGLFLASGQAIATSGPLGALLGYLLMGLITYSIALITGEISSFLPCTGGFVRHATFFLSPALGTATGWNFWYTMAITAPAELAAAATCINFWNEGISAGVWYTVFIVVIAVLNFAPVRAYGESEVFFAFLKISCIIGLIIAGIVVDLGGAPEQNRIGFRYWKNPGPFVEYLVEGNTGKFLGFWSTLISAGYSYANVQVIALAGAETRNPRRVIPEAVRMTFWRVMIFYVLSIFVVGLLVPSNDPNLGLSTGTASQSPFVIAFQRAGIDVLPSIINAVVLTSAFSCGSACVFLASRTLYGLAEEGQAPKLLLRTNRFGTPYLAVGLSLIFTPLVYLSLGSSSATVFGWFVNITTIAGFIGWAVIALTYLRFYYGMKAQNIDRNRLPYKSPLQPYMAWLTLFALIIVILTSGFSVFIKGNWSTSSFLTYYIDLAIFAGLWGVAWLFFRTGFVGVKEMDFSEMGVIEREREEEKAFESAMMEGRKGVPWWRRWVI